ncbi:MAG: cytidylate kinase-like family protein [Oscillospiraceae bacterium]|nr:cytidylate kinase-like family protein [Oscillospiraceae bacterium]
MVITVGRQYGSGGREIGTALAKRFGIAYYDDLLLKKAAEESGLCEELFHSFDERPKSFLYSIALDPYSFSMSHINSKGSIEQQVYLATYETIKKLADQGSCVLIGRCADYALKDRDDVINLFITAPIENRIKRVAMRNGISEDEAKERIRKRDKDRAAYYNFYSAKEWGDAKSYDLCIDSALLGIEGTVDLLEDLLKRKGLEIRR